MLFFCKSKEKNTFGEYLFHFLKGIKYNNFSINNLKLYKNHIYGDIYLDNLYSKIQYNDYEISNFINYLAIKCRKHMDQNVYFDIKDGRITFFI